MQTILCPNSLLPFASKSKMPVRAARWCMDNALFVYCKERRESHIPIHPTRQICFGKMPTFGIVGTMVGLDTFQIRQHDVFTLACKWRSSVLETREQLELTVNKKRETTYHHDQVERTHALD